MIVTIIFFYVITKVGFTSNVTKRIILTVSHGIQYNLELVRVSIHKYISVLISFVFKDLVVLHVHEELQQPTVLHSLGGDGVPNHKRRLSLGLRQAR